MKIADASIQSSSSHAMEASRDVTERLEVFSGGGGSGGAEEPAFVIDLGSAFPITTSKTYLNCEQGYTEDQGGEIKLKLIEDFIYQLTGKHVRLRSPNVKLNTDQPVYTASGRDVKVARPRDDWGLAYEYKEVSRESESLKFSSSGTVTTSDGCVVAFNIDFMMSREYVNEQYVNVRMGSAAKVDPLVVLFAGDGVPRFSALKQGFDLNRDGKDENISFATEGSGFLALDKNGDGVINDGGELFGPTKGNGFEELREYDSDRNGWIDETDDVFGKLSILTTSQDGKRITFKLGDAGIGAIYLNDVNTAFEFRDDSGTVAEMKRSSVFLRENGTAGTIHHIDLAI